MAKIFSQILKPYLISVFRKYSCAMNSLSLGIVTWMQNKLHIPPETLGKGECLVAVKPQCAGNPGVVGHGPAVCATVACKKRPTRLLVPKALKGRATYNHAKVTPRTSPRTIQRACMPMA